jgi:FKBP-type peptidyl-prolyl cis-trans isomerase
MKIKTIKYSLLILSVAVLVIAGCSPIKKWEREEKQRIQEYLAGLGDTIYVTKPSGLIYIELVAGTGALPKSNDTISVRYKGYFMSGRVFASNIAETSPMSYLAGTGLLADASGYLIEGLAEAGLYIREGGKAKIITPSSLAYGSNGYGLIPGFTPLVWELEVVDLRPASK